METYQFTKEKNLEQFYEMISAKKRNGFIIVEHNEKLPYVVLSKEKKAVNHFFSPLSYLHHIWFLVNCLAVFNCYAFAEEKHFGSCR